MDISDLKRMKKEAGLTNADIAGLSGIPVSTVNKIFSGATKNPRYATLLEIESFIRKNKGKCHVYASPFDVRLFGDASTIVQPDILVVCSRDILTEKGCSGAPDWVIEIVSRSNSSHDYVRKLMQYQKAGVREYWIVDPFQELISVFNFEDAGKSAQYGYSEAVPSGVLEGLAVCFGEMMEGY